MTTNHTEQH